MDLTDLSLRTVGAFYAFAGYIAMRAAMTSRLIDRAIAAIAMERTKAIEKAQNAWLVTAALVILAGGVMLMLLLELAAWVFALSALAQAAYLFVAAPRYFDVEEPPSAKGRQQSTNAFVIYCAATAFVVWAALTGRLLHWREVPWPLLAGAGTAVAAYAGYMLWIVAKPLGSGGSPLLGAMTGDEPGDPQHNLSQSKRIKVMADHDCHPLWALDGPYGDFAPDELGLSPELTRHLNAWAEAYTASLNRDDPANSRWSDEEREAHAAQARPLAVRLARERPDLMVYVLDGETGVVEVRPDEPI